jgi:hypothetical protein
MKGALPPSSIEVFSTFLAEASISLRPTSVEPVKDSLRSRVSSISGPVTLPDEEVVTMLNTPPGRPTSSSTWPSASIDNGVSCAGFMTIVHPAAIAGPTLRVPIAMGKFHGVIIRHGPTGCFNVSARLVPLPNCL